MPNPSNIKSNDKLLPPEHSQAFAGLLQDPSILPDGTGDDQPPLLKNRAKKRKLSPRFFKINKKNSYSSYSKIANDSRPYANQPDPFARSKLPKLNLLIAVSIIIIGTVLCRASETKAYDYVVRPGDTLSEITLMFTGTHDYEKIARQNRILNADLIYPGDRVTLPSSRPNRTLQDYLDAIYKSEATEAYKLLSASSRLNISFDEFEKALDEITFYNLDTIVICADFIVNENHILQLKIRLNEDPASWGFSLIREKYKWYILLFDLNPTNPQDDGFVKWECK